jgi:hypothetical protein
MSLGLRLKIVPVVVGEALRRQLVLYFSMDVNGSCQYMLAPGNSTSFDGNACLAVSGDALRPLAASDKWCSALLRRGAHWQAATASGTGSVCSA